MLKSIPFNAARPQQSPGRFPLIFHHPASLMRQHRCSSRSQARITAAKTIQRPSRVAGSKNQRRTSYPRFGHYCLKASCGIAGEHDRGFPACLFTRLFTCYAAWLPAHFACLPALSPTVMCLATVFSTLWLPSSDNLAKEPPMPQISAFPSIKALSILLLVPLNPTSLPWWTTLSIIAEASLSSPRIVPHLLNSMLVVNTTLRFS